MKKFILNIIRTGTKESSKRFISIFTTLLLAYVVVRFTTVENSIHMAWALITFISALVGVTATHDYFTKEKSDEGN